MYANDERIPLFDAMIAIILVSQILTDVRSAPRVRSEDRLLPNTLKIPTSRNMYGSIILLL